FQTGLVFISSSLFVMIAGPLSGFIASKISPKWLITGGMTILGIATFWLMSSLDVNINPWILTPQLILFGIGIGLASSQLTNVVLSAVDARFSGEASAANSTIRQVGTSIGTAIIGVILASTLTTNIKTVVTKDASMPSMFKQTII